MKAWVLYKKEVSIAVDNREVGGWAGAAMPMDKGRGIGLEMAMSILLPLLAIHCP
jgi:hypothetical protein